MKSVEAKWEAVFQKNYGTPKLNIVSGKGCYVTADSKKRYLDFIGGIATNVLGQAHPAITKAVRKQIGLVGHVSNLYASPTSLALAEKLIQMTGHSDARVFFCNSGAEANEAALKLSRKTGRRKVVSTIGGFHGRTMGALSLTGQPEKRDLFAPIIEKIKYVPFGDISAMSRAVNHKTAMVIVEPIQGENGVITSPAGYLRALREICDANGSLLVIDNSKRRIQTSGWESAAQRPIYFVQTRSGCYCRWISLQGSQMSLIPDPASDAPVLTFPVDEVDVLGQVVGLAIGLDLDGRRRPRA